MPSEEATRIKRTISVNDILKMVETLDKHETPKVSLFEWFYGKRPNIFRPKED